jgi:uncharacterized protein
MVEEPNLVISHLGGKFTKDHVSVEVHIVRMERDKEWTLEVVNSSGTSIVWDDFFASDYEAYEEFKKTAKEEGMQAFSDIKIFPQGNNVIPFRRK